MRTGRAGPPFLTSSDEDNEEDAPEGRRARPSDPWLASFHASVECDLVWGGYLDSTSRGQPMCKEGIDKIEREVNDFHSQWMNFPAPPPPQSLSPILGSSVSQHRHSSFCVLMTIGGCVCRPDWSRNWQ